MDMPPRKRRGPFGVLLDFFRDDPVRIAVLIAFLLGLPFGVVVPALLWHLLQGNS